MDTQSKLSPKPIARQIWAWFSFCQNPFSAGQDLTLTKKCHPCGWLFDWRVLGFSSRRKGASILGSRRARREWRSALCASGAISRKLYPLVPGINLHRTKSCVFCHPPNRHSAHGEEGSGFFCVITRCCPSKQFGVRLASVVPSTKARTASRSRAAVRSRWGAPFEGLGASQRSWLLQLYGEFDKRAPLRYRFSRAPFRTRHVHVSKKGTHKEWRSTDVWKSTQNLLRVNLQKRSARLALELRFSDASRLYILKNRDTEIGVGQRTIVPLDCACLPPTPATMPSVPTLSSIESMVRNRFETHPRVLYTLTKRRLLAKR